MFSFKAEMYVYYLFKNKLVVYVKLSKKWAPWKETACKMHLVHIQCGW